MFPAASRTLLCVLMLVAVLTTPAEAAHFRGGDISWQAANVATRTAAITATTSWNCSLYYVPCNPPIGANFTGAGSVNHGDNTFSDGTWPIVAGNHPQNWLLVRDQFSKSYPQSIAYTATFSSCCTVSNLLNYRDSNWNLRTPIDFTKDTASPISAVSPVVSLPGGGGTKQFYVAASDPGGPAGETLRWRLADSTDGYTGAPNPTNYTINPLTGVVTWNTTTSTPTGIYHSAVVIESVSATGAVLSSTLTEFIVDLGTNGANPQPVFQAPTPGDGQIISAPLNETTVVDVSANDVNAAQTVSMIQASALPPGVTLTRTAGNPASAKLTINPVSGQEGDFPVVLTAQDNGAPIASVSRSFILRIGRQGQNITFADPADRPYGSAPFPVSATSSSGLPVTVTGSGACTVADGVVTIVSAGTCTLAANQSGNTVYRAASPVVQTVAVATAPLNVKVNDLTRQYGDTTVPTLELSGFINGDTASSVTGTPTWTLTNRTNVGTYSVVPSGGLASSKYHFVYQPGSVTITRRPLTVTGANASRIYGNANGTLTGAMVGAVTGDSLGVAWSSPATLTSPVGTYAVNGTVSDPLARLSNYTVTSTPGTLTVTKRALTVTAGNASRWYASANPVFTRTIANAANGDTFTVDLTTAATPQSDVGSYPIVPATSGAALSNYTLTEVPGTLSVTKRPTTIAVQAAARVYGDANPPLTGIVSGLVAGDDVAVAYATAATPASAVGTYPITASTSGSKAANYQFVITNAVLTVGKRPLTFVADDASRAYGDPEPAFDGTITGIVNDDPITATYATSATRLSDAGSAQSIRPVAHDGPEQALRNYDPTYVDGTLSITPRALVVRGDDASRDYGDADPLLSGTLDGALLDDGLTAAWSTPATAASAVGSYPIHGEVSDSPRLANYAVSHDDGELTVGKRPLSATAEDATRVYGDANPGFTSTIAGDVNGDTFTVSHTTPADEASDAGEYPIVPLVSGAAAANYAVAAHAGTLTVTKRPLQVVPDNAARVYGDENPTLTGTILGVVNDDPITATYASPATAASPPGLYSIVATLHDGPGQALRNYDASVVNDAIFTVGRRPVTVKPDPATRVYGDGDPDFTATLTGLVDGDELELSIGTVAGPRTPVGTAPITAALRSAGDDREKYDVTFVDGVLSITERPLSVTADDLSRVYGDANPTLTGVLTGAVDGDELAERFTTAAVERTSVGTAVITAVVDDPDDRLGNYELTTHDGALTITPRELITRAHAASRVYGDPNPPLSAELEGAVEGDELEAVATTDAGPRTDTGDAPITPGVRDPHDRLDNYTLTREAAQLTITERDLAVSADDKERVYGEENPELSGELVGAVDGDRLAPALTTEAVRRTSVGDVPIEAGVSDPDDRLGNYALTRTDGTLTITERPLTVTAGDAARRYGDANPPLTATLDGDVDDDRLEPFAETGAHERTDAGEAAITPGVSDPDNRLGNYRLESVNGVLTIGKRPLSVTADDKERVYGDENPELSGEVAGAVDGDELRGVYATDAGPRTAVGETPITADVDDPEERLGNYVLTRVDGALTITKRALSLTADNKSRIYGEANPPLTGGLGGLVEGDEITGEYATEADPRSSVGGHPITAAFVDPDGRLGNYDAEIHEGTLTVEKRALTVTADHKVRTYGNENPELTGTLEGAVVGDGLSPRFTTDAVPRTSVGNALIEAGVNDPDDRLDNYEPTSNDNQLQISPRELLVSADDAERVYGDANPELTGDLEGAVEGDRLTPTFTTAAGPRTGVGSAVIEAGVADPDDRLGNYSVDKQNGRLTITERPLTLTADDKSRQYGEANPELTGAFDGLVAGDDITGSYATAATLSSDVDEYAIVPTIHDGDDRLRNYTPETRNGTLTVSKAPLTVRADDATRTYGDANPAFTATVEGLRVGDERGDVLQGDLELATAATRASHVGEYAIEVGGVTARNYAIGFADGTLKITKAPLKVIAEDKSRLFGDANPALTARYEGFVNDDGTSALGGTLALATPATPSSEVGTYPITASGLTARDYAITFVPGTLSVGVAESQGGRVEASKVGWPSGLTTDLDVDAKKGQNPPVGRISLVGAGMNIVTTELISLTISDDRRHATVYARWNGKTVRIDVFDDKSTLPSGQDTIRVRVAGGADTGTLSKPKGNLKIKEPAPK